MSVALDGAWITFLERIEVPIYSDFCLLSADVLKSLYAFLDNVNSYHSEYIDVHNRKRERKTYRVSLYTSTDDFETITSWE